MKTIFNDADRNEVIQRIEALQEKSKAQWGKMNVQQIITHCALWEEMVLQNKKLKRPLIGWLLGKIILKQVLKEGRVMRRNSPTIPELIVQQSNTDIVLLKNKWIDLVKAYTKYAFPEYSFVHPFFGKLTKEQVGYFAYKHADHHLRQFDC